MGPPCAEVQTYPAFLATGAVAQVPHPVSAAPARARPVPTVTPPAFAVLAEGGRHTAPPAVAPLVVLLAVARHGASAARHEAVPGVPGVQVGPLTHPVRGPVVEVLGHEQETATEVRAAGPPGVRGARTRGRVLATTEVAAGVAVAVLRRPRPVLWTPGLLAVAAIAAIVARKDRRPVGQLSSAGWSLGTIRRKIPVSLARGSAASRWGPCLLRKVASAPCTKLLAWSTCRSSPPRA